MLCLSGAGAVMPVKILSGWIKYFRFRGFLNYTYTYNYFVTGAQIIR